MNTRGGKKSSNRARSRGSKGTSRRLGTSRRRPPRASWLSRFFWYSLSAGVWLSLALAAVIAWYAHDLPDIANLEKASLRKPVITIQAADRSVVARYGQVHGRPVQVRDLPPHVPRAFLAIEDRRFYGHPGVDIFGIVRAALRNLQAGGIRQGGSTITQQLAKNLFLKRERTMRRKIQESLLAFWLEHRFTKDQILSVYLNRIYFGGGAYGVDAASRRYFARSAEKLTLFQAAVLAGLVKAPSRDNPVADPKRAAARANLVLASMAKAGWIKPRAARQARRDVVALGAARSFAAGARYFTDWVLDRVDDFIGYHSGDLIIRTTLAPRLQRLAQVHLQRAVADGAARNVSQGAFVALTPDGAVRAMVGGQDYGKSQYNRVTQARRQPGSAFKLFVYLAALEKGVRPGDLVSDRPITVNGWTPRNYGRKHRGEMTFREGAARSSNTVAVTLAERAGRKRVIRAARRLGITSPLRSDPSLALGAHEVSLLELAGAYAVVANGGVGVWPYGIEEISDGNGAVLYRRKGGGPGRVVESRYIESLNDLFYAVVGWGTGKAARLDRPAAGKTGTSQGNRDAWFIGYTPDLVAGAWLGNDNFTPMKGVTGGSLSAALWQRFMRDALKGVPARPLPGIESDLSSRPPGQPYR